MARVVPQRRSTPPYLMIVFIFLFVMASILAALQYNEADKARKDADQLRVNSARIAASEDLKTARVAKMMQDAGHGDLRKSVVQQFNGQQDMLTQLITGAATEFPDAVAAANKAMDKIASRRGLAVETTDLFSQLAALRDQNKKLADDLAAANEQVKTKNTASDKMAKDFAESGDQINKQLKEAEQKLQDQQVAYLKQLDSAKKEWEQVREALNQNLAAQAKQIQEQTVEIQKDKARIAILEGTNKGGAAVTVAQPDGSIISVNDVEGVCYINIGAKQRVVPGLTFTVFAQGAALTVDAASKGALVVTAVNDRVSTCRITKQEKANAITPGDVVSNLAFDAMRTFRFVVEGDFDLFGSGRATAAGAGQVKDLIAKMGGKIETELDPQIDYVVMGEEPIRPPRLAEGVPAQVVEAYKDQMKIYDRYNAVRRKAMDMKIPILNTNRFLALVGYNPSVEANKPKL